MTNNIEVLAPGMFTSIQDRGRIGYRKYGVPTSGVMDRISGALANTLLNNPINTPLLEITMLGPKLQFHTSTLIAITGANMSPQKNELSIPLNTAIQIDKGDIISFGKLQYGCRSYLAIKNGFLTQKILGSHSFYKPITNANTIGKGELLLIEHSPAHHSHFHASVKEDSDHFNCTEITCLKGPEFYLLSENDKQLLESILFTVSPESNRMGYRLTHTELHFPPGFNMLTSSVLPGTVQLTPSGKLIALMLDCQTTGGYPRILQLTSIGINRLAQKKAGDQFKFKLIN